MSARRSGRAPLLGTLAVLAFLALAGPAFAQFANESVVPNVTDGVTIAFLPDGRMLIGELSEKILIVPAGGSTPNPTPFLDLSPSGLQGEQGLMDVILDPNFATNQWYYVFYTHTSAVGNNDRVSRFTANGNVTVPGSELLIWQHDQPSDLEHHGGGIAFGPGGKLFISVGESFRPDDAQALNTYRGKLLRVNPDGTIPAGNPFADGAGPNKDEIWCYGFRNPFRISYDAVSDRLFVADVGGNDNNTAMEEINVAVAGANFGWPLCEGACGTPGLTSPLYAYPHSGRDASITGGFVYRGGNFPSAYQGSYFFADYVQNWIKRLTFDGSGNVTGVQNFEPPDGTPDGPTGDVVKLVQGPDGALYYADLGFNDAHLPNPAAIRRLRYTAGNAPPVVVADGNPKTGAAPLTVNFTSAGTFDPESSPLTYSWAFGDQTSSTAANPAHTYTNAGSYTARLTVSDGVNSTLSGDIVIMVGAPPSVTITSPTNGILFEAGDVITYSGTATSNGSPLPASAYRWDVLFHHETHVHPAGTFTGVTGGTFVIPTTGHDFTGTTSYEFLLTATDSTNGLQTTKSVTIFPDKVNLNFATAPAGLSLDVDGIRKVTPFTLDALKGFHYTINAPLQSFGGQSYDFVSWSDGGARSHEIVVPLSNASWTATFAAQSQASGLVAAYAFAEGSGPSTADGSGNGNSGNLVNATWTPQGKFGNALDFNGTNAMVSIPDAPPLHLGTAMTLEAWIYPTTSSASWMDVIMKWNDDYYLTGASPAGAPAVGSSITTPLYTATAPPVNAWSHVAATYDGTTLRIYLNGVQSATRALSGTLRSSGGALSIGGDALFGQYFAGRIDEVRVYNRALSSSEIQTDMNSAVITGVEGPEPTPPRANALLGASPNPFNPSTSLRVRLVSSANARLRVYDVAGRLVRSIDLSGLAPGDRTVTWDGTTNAGVRLSSGVYVARLEGAATGAALRLVLLR